MVGTVPDQHDPKDELLWAGLIEKGGRERMRARPVRYDPKAKNYKTCRVDQATHIILRLPGPMSRRVIPVICSGSRKGTGNWTWNGSKDKPTLRPSIKTTDGITVCHSWITDGRVIYLKDSTHKMAGQTLDLLDIEEDAT